jgi:hypothetical protein
MNRAAGVGTMNMRPEQIEAWVLRLVDLVADGKNVEDSRVELKRDWPADPNKVARRLAGHANACGSDVVLWVIGLDETQGVVPITPTDTADWIAQVHRSRDMGRRVRPSVVSVCPKMLIFVQGLLRFVHKLLNPLAHTP